MAPAPVVEEPLAGVSNSNMFLRSPDNMFVFFPNGRLQSDLYFFKSDAPSGVPKNSFFVKRARLELAGWIDNVVYFQVGAEFASAPAPANSNYVATDDFVALAPWGDLAILQVGQFDAPFTLENRTSDKYFDFIERSLTVRAFGIPTNKEEGAMLHGTNDARNYYYSAGFFNGDGQNFKNLDNSFDFMGRGWISPTSFLGEGPLHDITLGGSYWTGNRNFANPLANQTTAGGFKILDASTPKLGMDTTTLNQQGRHHTWALEVNAPIAHKFGVRWEFVHKNQPLSVIDTTMGPTSIAAGMHLKGSSQYFEAWAWVMGDDRIVGEPGMQMPTRYKKFGVKPPQHGLMLAARLELLDETLSADDQGGPVALLAVKPNSYGQTKVTSFTLGANYWISKRFRTMFNWTLNDFGGDANYVTCPASMMPASCGSLKGLGNAKTEQEFSFRLAIAL
ncbi:MAG TPA: porin [Polyangia bacterium]|nr:porin [Polyangia bacterium]